MLRLICVGSLILSAGALGCGAGNDTTGAGGTAFIEPGLTCIAFCAKAVGQCEAFGGDEAGCRQGCEEGLAEAVAHSETCGDAVEAVFQCATELDCQGVHDWRDKIPLDDYPCRSEVATVDSACPGL